MSRFWAAASSSEGEQGSDSDSYDEAAPTQKLAEKKFGATFEESDSESEDEVRVVKSQKDRKWDSMREGIVRIRNARKNSDWPLIQDEFANVNKMVEKSKMLIIQSGLPLFYVKMLAEVEDHVQLALKDKDTIKKMKPVVSRALNQMKLQVRKHNENYKDEIADCRANPEKYQEVEEESSSSSESESDSDSDASGSESDSDSDASSESEKPKAKPAGKPASAKKEKAATEDSDEDSLFGDNDDESSGSSESEDDGRKELKGRARWLKKVPTAVDPNKKSDNQVKRDARTVVKKKEYVEPTARKPVNTYVEVKLTEEELDRKVVELIATRGKKNTDPREVMRQLEVLTKGARLHGPRKEIPVLMHLISNMLDSQRSIDDYLEHQQWRTCYRSLYRVVTLMESNKKLSFAAVLADDSAELAVAAHLKVAVSTEPVAPSDPNVLKVAGSVESYIVRLQDEYTKSLQQINPHTKEYVLRLSDEASLVELAELVLSFYLRTGDSKAAASVSQLIVDHMYYKHDSHAVAVRRAHLFNKTWGKYSDLHPACVGKITLTPGSKTFPKASEVHPAAFMGNPTVTPAPFNPGQRLQELCTYIFKYGDKRIKTHALLALVHHHALHDRYYKARDMLLISHIQEFADKFDVKTQILYNRAIVTLGLCAFRLGLYQKAHDCLTGICSGRAKELLAQGQMRWADKDPEQEKIERRRQMPFHMHINPDLLELCHLTSAMILELPHLARSATGAPALHQNVISRQFRKYLNGYSKQVFRGPPENTREHVLAATKALLSGEWQKAVDLLMGLEVWKLIPNDGAESAKVLLRARLQEEAVRTFLLLNGDHYESLSLTYICDMFGMDQVVTRRIISRMIFNREISAAWEQPADILVIYKTELSAVQTLSQGLAEKLSLLLESNERILDPLVGVYGFKDDWNSRGGDNRNKYGDNRGGDNRGGGKYRQQGGYKTGNKPVVTRQQNPKDRNFKGRPGAGQGQGGATGGAQGGKNAWSGSRPNKPRYTSNTDQQPGGQQQQQQQAPKKWASV